MHVEKDWHNMTQIKKTMIGHINTLQKKPIPTSMNKPPVLLVHGAWHGAWCWEGNYLDYFADAGHETWAMDLRGHGDSANTKPFRLTTIGDYVKDVEAVIEVMPAPPIVIGHSMGGLVCQHVLNGDANVRGIGLLASLPASGVAGTKIKAHPLKTLQSTLTWSLYPMVSDRKNAAYMFLDLDADEATIDRLMDNLGDEAYFAFLGMLAFALPKAPKMPLQTPVCVVSAENDTIIPVKLQETLAARFDVTANVIANAPHDLMLSKRWEDSARVFLNWIETLPGAASA